eukprot:PLAT2969.1.p2 GENE.PLAT2969.1~~PLAT2969.1.p2  ORF type:complete len:176 (+),score=49.97 PLAT2969.1:41-529(+)
MAEDAPAAPALARAPSIGTVSTHVFESAFVAAPAEDVWAAIRPLNFAWWPAVESVEFDGPAGDSVGALHTIKYADGAVWTVKLVALSDMTRSLSFHIVASEPALHVMSALHTITVRRVTETNDSFVEWSTDFSNDADTAVVEDSRFKKLEAFAGLRDSLKSE